MYLQFAFIMFDSRASHFHKQPWASCSFDAGHQLI